MFSLCQAKISNAIRKSSCKRPNLCQEADLLTDSRQRDGFLTCFAQILAFVAQKQCGLHRAPQWLSWARLFTAGEGSPYPPGQKFYPPVTLTRWGHPQIISALPLPALGFSNYLRYSIPSSTFHSGSLKLAMLSPSAVYTLPEERGSMASTFWGPWGNHCINLSLSSVRNPVSPHVLGLGVRPSNAFCPLFIKPVSETCVWALRCHSLCSNWLLYLPFMFFSF